MTVEGFEETSLTQNPELGTKQGEVAARFMFRTKKGEINMVVEVGPETRKKLFQSKLKMGWLICRAGDYLVAKDATSAAGIITSTMSAKERKRVLCVQKGIR
jgi:hypothetical protein